MDLEGASVNLEMSMSENSVDCDFLVLLPGRKKENLERKVSDKANSGGTGRNVLLNIFRDERWKDSGGKALAARMIEPQAWRRVNRYFTLIVKIDGPVKAMRFSFNSSCKLY